MIPRFWNWLGFHVHDWGKWKQTNYMRYHDRDTAILLNERGYEVTYQERECTTCGKTQVKRV